MNRRQFFATLGIPALTLPLVKLVKPSRKDNIHRYQIHNLTNATCDFSIAIGICEYCSELIWDNEKWVAVTNPKYHWFERLYAPWVHKRCYPKFIKTKAYKKLLTSKLP